MKILFIPFVPAELVLAAVWLLFAAVRLCRKKTDLRREAALLLMYVNLAVIFRFTFFPMATESGHVQPLQLDTAEIIPFRINLIPFVFLFDYSSGRDLLLNLIGNVALFIPGGILLPVFYQRLNSFCKVTAAGAMLSLCIEFLQLPFSSRASDIDDLILNTLGVMTGYCIYALFARRSRKAETGQKK